MTKLHWNVYQRLRTAPDISKVGVIPVYILIESFDEYEPARELYNSLVEANTEDQSYSLTRNGQDFFCGS